MKVSVIIPAFNSEETIKRAILSCQGLEDSRVIVVDDGSTDSTAVTAHRSGAEVIQQQNAGASVARMTGILATDSPLIVLLDADDELVVPGVRRSIQMLDENPATGVVGGRVLGVWPNGKRQLLKRSYKEVSTESLIKVGYGPWPPAASVIRRTSLDEASSLAIPGLSTRYAEDYELLLRLSLVGRIEMHDATSTSYRLYAGKSSTAPVSALRDKEAIRAHYASVTGVSANLMSSTEIYAAACNRAARAAWANQDYSRALLWGARGMTRSPLLLAKKLRGRLLHSLDQTA